MKAYFFLLTVIFYIVHAKAQQNNIFKNKPWEDFRKKALLTQKLNQMNFKSNNNKSAHLAEEEQDDKSVLKVPLTATYEGNNGRGADIFAMQPYNMPCIVPDKTFRSNMPLAETGKSEKGFVSLFKRFQENKEKK